MSEKHREFLVCYRSTKESGHTEYILKFPETGSLSAAAQLVGQKIVWPVDEHKVIEENRCVAGKDSEEVFPEKRY